MSPEPVAAGNVSTCAAALESNKVATAAESDCVILVIVHLPVAISYAS